VSPINSRELIRDIVALRPAPRRGFWLGNPHPDTWPIYHKYFGSLTEEELRLKLGDDFRWITPQYMASGPGWPARKPRPTSRPSTGPIPITWISANASPPCAAPARFTGPAASGRRSSTM
jgi:hypothetical protein